MKLRAQLIVIPCVGFGARARLTAESGGLTPIELLALRTIGGGVCDAESMAQFLGLGRRPALDLIYDFWLKGYVVVDTARATVQLAGVAERAFARGTLAELESAENNLEVVALTQELVSGAVLPTVGRPHPIGAESALVPTERTGLALEGVTRAELLDAVQAEVERQSRQKGRDLTAHEAWVEPDQLFAEASAANGGIQPRRFLPVWADIQHDPDSGRLLFDLVEAPGLPPPVQRGVARGLSLLAERLPEQLFFKRLRQEFEKQAVTDVVSMRTTALERLGKTLQGLEGTDPGVVEDRHRQIRGLFRDACSEVQARAREQADIEAVVGYDHHEERIRELISTAKRQIVLGNPWVTLDALLARQPDGSTWFDLLEGALERGVQVFLLWGISPDSILDGQAKNALNDLAARHGNALVFGARSSTIHAKFVVTDARAALVTSYNFLDPPRERTSLELGVIVRGTGDDVATNSVLDLLEWTRSAFPDHVAAQRLLLLPSELGMLEQEPLRLPRGPQPPPEDVLSGGDEAGPSIRHWERSWLAAFAELSEVGRGFDRGADLIQDREHRELLWGSLRDSVLRLGVLSDRVSVDVVTDRFVRMLQTRLDADVPCTLLFRREGASDRSEGPASRLRGLAESRSELCKLVEAPSHAKLLVADDQVTIGSFNFLSYGGEYTAGTRERAELSIRIRDRSFVDVIVKALDAEWPGAFAALRCERPGPTDSVVVRAPPRLQPLFAQLRASSDAGKVLTSWFKESASPWDDLKALSQAAVPARLLDQATAAAVSVADDLESGEARLWRARMALSRWSAGDFVGACLIHPGDSNPGVGPPRWLANLAATVSAGLDRGDDEMPAVPSEPEATAAALFLLVAVLKHGRFEMLDSLSLLEERLPAWAAGWPPAVHSFYEATYQPLPVQLLRRTAATAQRAADLRAAREELDRALVRAENVGFIFPIGANTWKRLRMPGYLLGELRGALEDDEPARATRLLERLVKEGKTPEAVMDEVSFEVRDEHNSRIHNKGGKRTSCLKRLNRAVEATWAWASLHDTEAPTLSETRVLAACAVLRLELAELDGGAPGDSPALVDAPLKFARSELAPLLGGRSS